MNKEYKCSWCGRKSSKDDFKCPEGAGRATVIITGARAYPAGYNGMTWSPVREHDDVCYECLDSIQDFIMEIRKEARKCKS